MPTEPSGIADSPSLDADLAPTDSETESDEEVPGINAGDQDEGQAGPNPGVQDEGQAGPNPGVQDEGQAGSNPGDAAKSQPQSSHVVHAGPNLEHMDLEATDASTQQNTEQMDEEFTTTAYPNVQENLKLPTEDQVILEDPTSSTGTLSSLQNLDKELSFTNQFLEEKPQEDEPEKTNTESEVQSMVTVPIHQDTSSVPPMATPVIDLTVSHPVSTTVHAPLPTSTTTTTTITTTSLPPPPPQPQQSSSDPILLQRIGELEQHIADLIQSNLALEERLDKHGTRLYNLENLNIPQKVSKAVDEIVTDAVDWAMQAPLRARFSDLPAVDMKEVLQQRMFKDKSYLAHEDHKNLFEALEKSLERDHSNQLLSDLEEARRKKRKKRASPRTPSGSPPSQPPPPPPPAGASGAPDSLMNEDSILEEHVQLSDDEDTGNDHLPNADMRKGWWKPLPEEERPIGDMTTFMNWYCSKVNKTLLIQADFERQAYEVVKNFYLDVIHLQFQMEDYHKMLTDQINWTNPEGLKEYLRYGNKGSRPALSISKMKVARYPDFGLELLVPEQMWIDEVCTYDISAAYGISHWWFNRQKFYIERHDYLSRRREVRNHMRILSVVSIKAYSRYSDFEDLNLLLLQGHLDHLSVFDKRMLSTAVKLWTRNLVIRQRVEDFQLSIESYQKQLNLTKPRWDAKGYEFKHDYTIIESPRAVVFPVNHNERTIMRFNEIYKFSDGTSTRILEALDYIVKEFKIKRLNPDAILDSEGRDKEQRVYWVFNSLVHSLRALSTLRRSGLRTASAAAKPYQGDSS
ncbi:hypothetical protein Tco_0724147 [Tanacetum coccineum]